MLAVPAVTAYACAAFGLSPRVGRCVLPALAADSNPAAGPSPPFSAHYGAFRNGTTLSGGDVTMVMTRCAQASKA
jgi:hypothetical protein